jgi:hypothetical protein
MAELSREVRTYMIEREDEIHDMLQRYYGCFSLPQGPPERTLGDWCNTKGLDFFVVVQYMKIRRLGTPETKEEARFFRLRLDQIGLYQESNIADITETFI